MKRSKKTKTTNFHSTQNIRYITKCKVWEIRFECRTEYPETIQDELKQTNTIEMSTKTDSKSIEVELCEKEAVVEERKKENTAEMSIKIDVQLNLWNISC